MNQATYKETKTGAEIAAEITRLIYANPDVRSRGAQFHISAATYQEPDETGCNWNVTLAKATPGYDSVLHQALADVRARYVLKH